MLFNLSDYLYRNLLPGFVIKKTSLQNCLDNMIFTKIWDRLNLITRLRQAQARRDIYSAEEFRAILERERARADHDSYEFSLAIFHAESMDSGHTNVRGLSCVITQRMRYTDKVGWFNRRCIGLLLPGTSADGAWKLAHEISKSISQKASPPACMIYTYPSQWLPGIKSHPERQWIAELFSQRDTVVPESSVLTGIFVKNGTKK